MDIFRVLMIACFVLAGIAIAALGVLYVRHRRQSSHPDEESSEDPSDQDLPRSEDWPFYFDLAKLVIVAGEIPNFRGLVGEFPNTEDCLFCEGSPDFAWAPGSALYLLSSVERLTCGLEGRGFCLSCLRKLGEVQKDLVAVGTFSPPAEDLLTTSLAPAETQASTPANSAGGEEGNGNGWRKIAQRAASKGLPLLGVAILLGVYVEVVRLVLGVLKAIGSYEQLLFTQFVEFSVLAIAFIVTAAIFRLFLQLIRKLVE